MGTFAPGLRAAIRVSVNEVTLDGNNISCDRFGCRANDTFEGELSHEDVRVRYHMLGWRFTDDGDPERHYCPFHF
jgi:hypothetical protein